MLANLFKLFGYRLEKNHSSDPRPIVKAFALEMEAKLKENDHKGGWRNMERHALLCRLYEEASELGLAMYANDPRRLYPQIGPCPTTIREEAADVANFAMFIADNFGELHPTTDPTKGRLPE